MLTLATYIERNEAYNKKGDLALEVEPRSLVECPEPDLEPGVGRVDLRPSMIPQEEMYIRTYIYMVTPPTTRTPFNNTGNTNTNAVFFRI